MNVFEKAFPEESKEINRAIEEAERRQSGPLSQEGAHDEANTIRANIGVSPETGKIDGRDPTAQDYERAVVDLEKLKALTLKNMDSVISSTTIIDELISLPFFGAAFVRRFKNAITGSPNEIGARWQGSQTLTEAAVERFFGEAISEMRKSMKAGKEFGRSEAENSVTRETQ